MNKALNQANAPENREKQAGVVVSLQICPAHRAPMEPRETVRAIENLGLEGDRHAVPDVPRQVLLVEQEVLDRFGLAAGAVKENITTSGVQLMDLAPGTRLGIGAAVLELTKACHPCSRMDEIRPGLQEMLEGQRGMLARVLHSGEIRLGDVIRIV
ncbi:MAG: MOSC domain-containing protein [Rudaea sp.]